MNCRFCDDPLPVGSNPRRLFCNDAHKMKWHRQQQQDDQHAALLAELEVLRAKVADQAHTIELQQQEIERLAHHYKLARQFQDDGSELEQENTRLKKQLDVERRYLEDIKPYTFKSWLRKQTSPLRDILVTDQGVPPKTSRAGYEAHVRRLAPGQMEEFTRLWKLMLLSRA